VASATFAPTGDAALMSPERERARKRLVWAVLAIYLLAIFEGAIRKYIAPQFGQYIFFIRDPFLIYVYILATRFALWPPNRGFFALSLFMCVLGVLLLFMQIGAFGVDNIRLLLGVYGWRAYFFYVPLAFLMGAQFRRADLLLFARVTLLLAVPIAMLVLAQFASPPNAPVNVGVAEEQALQFKSVGITADRIRTTGTFTAPAGQQQFIASAFALLLAMLLLPRKQSGVVFFAVTACGVLTCLALSGSRGAMLHCAIVGLAAVSVALVSKNTALKAKAVFLPASLVVAAVILYPIIFPEGFATFMSRWNAAAGSEGGDSAILVRAVLGMVDFVRLISEVPVLGYGIGYGGNASVILKAEVDGIMPGLMVEADLSRQMVDLGPIFGMGYILFRVAFVMWLGILALRATRRSVDPLPLMLYAYAGVTIITGQITGNGSINAYAWLFTGLCIAAAREASVPLGQRTTRMPAHGATAPLRRPVARTRRTSGRPLMRLNTPPA
jgi:hypothetical protein